MKNEWKTNEKGRKKQKKDRNQRKSDKKGKMKKKRKENTTRMRNKGGMKQTFEFFVLGCWPLSGQTQRANNKMKQGSLLFFCSFVGLFLNKQTTKTTTTKQKQ